MIYKHAAWMTHWSTSRDCDSMHILMRTQLIESSTWVDMKLQKMKLYCENTFTLPHLTPLTNYDTLFIQTKAAMLCETPVRFSWSMEQLIWNSYTLILFGIISAQIAKNGSEFSDNDFHKVSNLQLTKNKRYDLISIFIHTCIFFFFWNALKIH